METKQTPPLIRVQHLKKRFGKKEAVVDVSFAVYGGEVFGLLGPNGAGKTTTIRMILDVFKPTAGHIQILGGPLTSKSKDSIGYMPEERGLYPHMRVLECLIYLARLKGLGKAEARRRATAYLERLELGDQHRTKIEALSRGMTQKVQVIAAIIHQPAVLIIDEPFANLDPVNAQLVRQIILEIRERGGAVIMTSHQLALVESLCDRIAMINAGRVVLEGSIAQVRRQFARNLISLTGTGELPPLPENLVAHIERRTASEWLISLQVDTNPRDILPHLLAAPSFTLDRFEIDRPTLDEIFVQIVRGDNPLSTPPPTELESQAE